MTDDDLIRQLRNSKGWPTLGNAAADRIEALRAALDEAEAERHRWTPKPVSLAKPLPERKPT